jgi:hypothetical protein
MNSPSVSDGVNRHRGQITAGAGSNAIKTIEKTRSGWGHDRRPPPTVCTENLNTGVPIMKSAQDGACLIAGHSIGPKVVLLNIATAEMLEPIVIMRWELPALKVDTERHPPPRVRKGSLSSRVACYAFFCSAAASFLVGLASTGPIGSFRCFSAIWGARYSRSARRLDGRPSSRPR